MKIKIILYFIAVSILQPCYGFTQDVNFYLQAPDTVAIGKPFEVNFIIENAKGQIEVPEFIGLKLVGGPNQSSSMSIINGEMSQSMSISYILMAEEEGDWVIERAHLDIDGILYETIPKAIVANISGPSLVDQHNNSLSIFDDFRNFGDFNWNSKIIPKIDQKPKLSKKDSILNKYKVKKF